jgi:broad specificity phosphatase PhoE
MRGSAVTTVVLARHGETEWNRSGRKQGRLDSPLTARGRAHAGALAEAAAGLKVDAVFASPLGRAVATAAVCAGRTGLPVVVIDELAEVDHGAMAGLTTGEIERRHPGELDRRAADKYRWRFPGGESYADADRRIGRMLLRRLLGEDPATALARHHPHDVLYRVEIGTRTLTGTRLRVPIQPH